MSELEMTNPESYLDVREASLRGAFEYGKSLAPDKEVLDILTWFEVNSSLAFTREDQFGQVRLVRATGDTTPFTVTFVDDTSPEVRLYPELRNTPYFHENLRSVSLPIEATSSSLLLSLLLLHEGVHARDYSEPDHFKRAQLLLPELSAEEAGRLMTEIQAFEMEGKLLDALQGQPFAKSVQAAVDEATERYLNGDNQLAIDVVPLIEPALSQKHCFVTDKARDFCLSMLGKSVNMSAGLRVVNQMCDSIKVPEQFRAANKVIILGDDYTY